MSASADRPPSVDKLARSIADVGLPHPMLVDAARAAIAAGAPDSARSIAVAKSRRMLRPVINSTGTILHTNLGRAPMAWEQPERYTNLELDLTTGQRGSRMATAGALIAKACGAEDAIIVNNCAAAVLLGLGGLAEGRDVAVSRSELVEIGGGFRIPDVMARSGANLIEVGTTNRTRVDDFRGAVDDPNNDVAVVLRVHQSNYTIVGFTEAPTTAQLAGLNAPLVADIGSGLLDSRCPWLEGDPPGWLADEPAARQTLDGGAGLVMFSGDKLFGGPQAGIIAGDAELVRKCAAHPLARALRPGSLVLAALQATALAYLAEDGDAIPFWRMASLTVDQLRKRADAYGVGEIVDVMSTPGGGTLPGVEIPSVGVAVEGDQREALRELDHPIIARVDHGDSSAGETTVLDLRTIHPDDDEVVAGALRSLPSAT
ncbi:MAG: L-seryl-tRNA(Sec) selenium transferase [Actinomycetota bacterium]|nr:L-seryl-tRNA(Sec) selenium transferase [Actinomycetota bacterium]